MVTRSALHKVGPIAVGLVLGVMPASALLLALTPPPTARIRLRRVDLVWPAAAVAFALPSLARHTFPGESVAILAGMLGMLGAARLAKRFEATGAGLGTGIVLGLAVTAIVAAAQIVGGSDRATGLPWTTHANFLGHAALVLGGSAAAVATGAWAWAALIATASIALLSGSRAALLGAACLSLAGIRTLPRRRTHILISLGLALLTLLVATATPVGRRLLPASSAALHAILSPTQAIDPRNVLRDSEDLTAAAWRPAGVAIERLSPTAPIAWRLHKTREGSHVGVRQLVTLTPSSDYVVSAQFRASNAQSRPGLYGETPGGTSVEVTRKGGVWTARASGKLEVASLGTQPVDGGWVRVVVGLHTTGDTALSLYLGPAVDRRSAALGTSADVRALQVERGPAFTGYRPATEESWQVAVAAEAAVSRLRFWSIALNGFSQHPWTGLGIEHFAQRYRAALPEDQRGNVVPVHPHSLALAVAFDAGVPGLLGLVLLLTGIVASMRSAPRGSQLRHLALGTLVALLVANLFDFTFFHSSLFYPLCALAGWCRPQEQRSRIP